MSINKLDLEEVGEELDLEKEYPLPQAGERLLRDSGEEENLLIVDPLGMTDHTRKRLRNGRWRLYTDGYKRAGDILASRAKEEFAPDELLYPILFLYRHYLELELKGLVAYSSRLTEERIELTGLCKENHNLSKLWQMLEKNLGVLHLNPEMVTAAEAWVHELHKVDTESQAFRYPFDRKDQQTMCGLDAVNIQNLSEKMTSLRNLMSVMFETIGEALDYQNEVNQM
jgi:hypothetical protein